MNIEQSTINQSSSINPFSSRNNGQKLEIDNHNSNQHQNIIINNNNSTIIYCQERTRLPIDYRPRDIDVLCGLGKGSYEHVGNQKLKDLILKNGHSYVNAKTKTDKSQIIKFIVAALRESGTYFVKKEEDNYWYDIGNKNARLKVSHSIRDHLNRTEKIGGEKRENSNSRNAIRTNTTYTMIKPFQTNEYVEPARLERQISSTPKWSQLFPSDLDWS